MRKNQMSQYHDMPSENGIVFEKLKDELVRQYHEFNQFKVLYYTSELRIHLLNETAKHFFGDLFFVLLERIILNICKLTDKASSCGQDNLSIAFFHASYREEPQYPKECDQLVADAEEIGQSLQPWRSKSIAHNDLMTALGKRDIGEIFPDKFEQFYIVMQKYVDIVNRSSGKGPFDLLTPDYYGATDLIKALKYAAVFRDLLEHDPIKYDDVLMNHTMMYA